MNATAIHTKGFHRLFSALLSFVIFCSMLVGVVEFTSFETSAFDPTSYAIPTSGTTDSYKFKATPAVYEMGDGYAVIWATSFDGTGYIKYTYGGTEYTVYDEVAGIVKTNDYIHVVKVPHEHLLGNSYTVYSQVVTNNNASTLSYGTTISCGPLTLRKYDSETSIDILQLTDTHNYADRALASAKQFSTTPDLIVFTGDVASYIRSKDEIVTYVFSIMSKVSRGQFPVVFCRGNHDGWGRYGAMLLDYVPTETGEFYFDFEYGPLYGVVIDTGEDVAPSNNDPYNQVTNFDEYMAKQKAWLSTLRPSSKPFSLAIYHIPILNKLRNTTTMNYAPLMNSLGFHFGICGHNHSTSWKAKGSYGLNFPQIIVGGDPYASDVTAARLSFNVDSTGTKTLDVRAASQSGTTKIDKSITLESVKGTPDEVTLGETGREQQISVSNTGLTFATKPVVLEVGDPEYYTVCFATTTRAMAFVEYTYDGVKYQHFDSTSGARRTYDPIHTIKVPKAHLDNNSYRVGALEYTKYDAPYTLKQGNGCISEYFAFECKSASDEVRVFNVPDLVSSASSDTEETVTAAIKALGTKPALIIANGDSRASVYDADALVSMIDGLADVSSSAHPVLYVRGDRDNLGYYTGMLTRYLQNDKFYYTVDYMNYTFVVLDTLAVADSHSSLLVSESYLEAQNKWVSSLRADSGKNLVVISHVPLDTYDAKSGYSWRKTLEAKGADIFVSGNDTAGSFGITVTDGRVLSVEGGGYNAADASATVADVLLTPNGASVRVLDNSGAVVSERSFTLAGATETGTPSAEYAISPKQDSGLYVKGGMLYGVKDGSTLDAIRASLANTSGVSISGVGTGATITLTVDGRVLDTVTLNILGDLDGDGSIDASDYMEMKNAVIEDEAPSGFSAYAADANGDGIITSLDLLLLSSYVSGVVKDLS